MDFIVEIDRSDFDLIFLSETWRHEVEETVLTPGGNKLFLAGGAGNGGVGICISRQFCCQMREVTFHAFSFRLCSLKFTVGNKKFMVFACYFPTTWMPDATVFEMYGLLNLLLRTCVREGRIPLLGGDFNACIGLAEGYDLVDLIGACGMGERNERGNMLMQFVLEHGLQILNRQLPMSQIHESWTCARSLDGALVQIDFLVADTRLELLQSWNDFSLPIGLDHRSVHCKVKCNSTTVSQKRVRSTLKGWKLHLNHCQQPGQYHDLLFRYRTKNPRITFDNLEGALIHAGLRGGNSCRDILHFCPSPQLQSLRRARRTTLDAERRKTLSLQIRKLQQREARPWKSEQLRLKLGRVVHWKSLRGMDDRFVGRRIAQQPSADDFAVMLQTLFGGKPSPPEQPALLTESAWTLSELTTALAKMKVNKSGDDSGIVVELVQFASRTFLQDLLHLYNVVLNTGNVPCAWNKTMFIMLAKFKNAKLPSDIRPIASVRTLYKVFTYMVLARVEPVLEASQPEEQHGFRCGRRLEEHLVSANLVIDKLPAVGKPVWIVSLDLSKAFDRVNWSKLWAALASHGVSQHLVWIIQCLYWKQEGCVKGDTDLSNCFPIKSGVRQGCVLSPKLFSSVQQWAMRKWRLDVEHAQCGIDLQDGLPKLLDLRFADVILLFAGTAQEALFLLETLMHEFAEVGLLLNGKKTVVLTNKAQPPSHLWTQTGIKLQVKNGSGGHKWLGCILGVGNAGRTTLDLTYHLQAVSKAFFANRNILCDQNVPVKDRLRYFDAVVSPVALFGCGHRTVHQKDLHQLDVACRKFLRAVVGPPSNIDWSRPVACNSS